MMKEQSWHTAMAIIAGLLFCAACSDSITPPSGSQILSDLKRGGGQQGGGLVSATVSIPGTTGNMLQSDGAGSYVDGECGVTAYKSNDLIWFRASSDLKGKALREAEECPAFPRSWQLMVNGATQVHDPAGPSDHTADVALSTLIASGDVDDPSGRTISDGAIRLFGADTLPAGASTNTTGSFEFPYCLAVDGSGPPLKFNEGAPGNGQGSDLLAVTVAGDGKTFVVTTQPYPNNVAWCAHGRTDGTEVVLLLHLDLAYEVALN